MQQVRSSQHQNNFNKSAECFQSQQKASDRFPKKTPVEQKVTHCVEVVSEPRSDLLLNRFLWEEMSLK